MRLLAAASSRGRSHDPGFCLMTTTVGISAEQLVGHVIDENTTRVITDVNIQVFGLRRLGVPLHDYIPLVAIGERMVSAISSALLYLPRPSHLHTGLKSFQSSEARAEELRRAELNYCQRLLQELHQRQDSGDTTPSILGDVLRQLPEPLTPKEELIFMSSLVGASDAAVRFGPVLSEIFRTFNWTLRPVQRNP